MTGTATPDCIKKGVCVQFTADVDKQHAARDKVSEKKPSKKHAPAKKNGSADDAGDSKGDKKAAGD